MVRLIIVIMLLTQLAACSSGYDPKTEPTTVTYSMVADEKVNPNVSGEATPIEIQVFELEDDSMFLAADYDQLVDDAEKALKSNYVDHSDYALLPGQFKYIGTTEVDDDTRYIGVMARYADPENSQWKKVVRVKSLGREYHILMLFQENEVNLNIVE
ncbi:type VI secretion system lipoprotein TssJ [Photobacterium indicum]|uniref:type VI secretion system lipoprotein TssJ n=1 Tax=Photobacterium indicum TaxID=81447 RepID=UPI003D0E6662